MSGKNIKKLRMEYEISVQRLAAYMRIEQEELLDWEAGIRVPDEEQLERLAQLFQVDSSELIDAKERSVMKKQRESKPSDQKNKKQKAKKGKTRKKTKRKTKHRTDHKTNRCQKTKDMAAGSGPVVACGWSGGWRWIPLLEIRR